MLYIGSSMNVKKRYKGHVGKSYTNNGNFYKYLRERKCKIEDLRFEVEMVVVRDGEELRRVEGERIKDMKPKCNVNIPGQANTEVECECGKIVKHNNMKIHRESNEHTKRCDGTWGLPVDPEIVCECGKVVMKVSLNSHKRSMEHRQRMEGTWKVAVKVDPREKVVCECGKEVARGSMRQHKESMEHKRRVEGTWAVAVKVDPREKVKCDCGKEVRRGGLSEHKKSMEHKRRTGGVKIVARSDGVRQKGGEIKGKWIGNSFVAV